MGDSSKGKFDGDRRCRCCRCFVSTDGVANIVSGDDDSTDGVANIVNGDGDEDNGVDGDT
jgi:hypothetical protein